MQPRMIIESAWENREELKISNSICTIEKVIELLDKGEIKVESVNSVVKPGK